MNDNIKLIVRILVGIPIALLSIYIVYRVSTWIGNPRWFTIGIFTIVSVDCALMISGISKHGLYYWKNKKE